VGVWGVGVGFIIRGLKCLRFINLGLKVEGSTP
jgi:hypothetical protein